MEKYDHEHPLLGAFFRRCQQHQMCFSEDVNSTELFTKEQTVNPECRQVFEARSKQGRLGFVLKPDLYANFHRCSNSIFHLLVPPRSYFLGSCHHSCLRCAFQKLSEKRRNAVRKVFLSRTAGLPSPSGMTSVLFSIKPVFFSGNLETSRW